MRKLQWYYLKETAINALLTFAILFGMAAMSFLYKALSILKGGGLVDAISTTFLLAVDILPHLLNATLMFAVVLTYARAAQDREATAAQAAGISLRTLLVPALLLGLLCSLLSSWALHYEIPQAHLRRFEIIATAYKGKLDMMLSTRDRIEFDEGGIMTWQRRSVEDDRGVYLDVSIMSPARRHRFTLGLPGDKGSTFYTAERAWFDTDLGRGKLTAHFRGLRMPAVGSYLESFSCQIDLRSATGARTHDVSTKDLRSDILLSEVLRGVQTDPVRAGFTVHRRSCIGLLPFLLAPVAFCIGIMFRHRGRAAAIGFCTAPIGLIYVVDFLSESALRKFSCAPVGWLPAAAIFIAGFPLCWKYLRL